MDSVEYESALASLQHRALWECANQAGIHVHGVRTPEWLREQLLAEFEKCGERGQERLMNDAVSLYDSKIMPEFKLAEARDDLERIAHVLRSAEAAPTERLVLRASVLIALCNSYTAEVFKKT